MNTNGRHPRSSDLDPRTGPDRWEGLVSTIVEAAGPELLRRREQQDAFGVMVSWARPALSAAATVALLFVGSFAMLGRTPAEAVASQPAVESSVVPEEMVAWVVAGYEPTISEIVLAAEEFQR